MISPGYRVSAVRLLFQRFIIYPRIWYIIGSSNVQEFQTARYSCAPYASARGVAHHNESVDYIADTALRFLSSVCLICYQVPLSNSLL